MMVCCYTQWVSSRRNLALYLMSVSCNWMHNCTYSVPLKLFFVYSILPMQLLELLLLYSLIYTVADLVLRSLDLDPKTHSVI